MKKTVRFSLAGLLLFTTIVAVWLAKVANDVRQQKAAIRAIREHDGLAKFKPRWEHAPAWLKSALGEDFFQRVVSVGFATNQGRRPGTFQFKASDEILASLSALKDTETLELGYAYRVTDAGLEHLQPMKKLKTLYLYRTNVVGTGLAKLRQLQSVSLSHSRLNDTGLAVLGEMPQLTWLRLDHTDITDAGLKHLYRLAQLADVSLVGTRITSEGVAKLRQALPNCTISFEEFPVEISDELLFAEDARPTAAEIEEVFNDFETPSGDRMTGVVTSPGPPVAGLELRDLRVTPRVIATLIRHQLPELRELTLEGRQVGDELVRRVSELPLSLRILTITRATITDQAMVYLATMETLEELDLRNNNELTDAGFRRLRLLSGLRSLKIGYTGATPQGVQELKKALPNCEVAW